MKSENRSAAVFKGFEKMFRLSGLYQGNRDVLMQHVNLIDKTLSDALEDPEFQEGLLQFDFLMTAVYSDGNEVFRPDRPEVTMSYSLFCEGVKSVIVSRGFSGLELFEWISLLRDYLRPDRFDHSDLASILWRNRFQHLRVRIYNALLEVDEIGENLLAPGEETDVLAIEENADRLIEDAALEGDFKKKRFGQGRLEMGEKTAIHSVQGAMDEFWSLPSADRRALKAIHLLSDADVNRLKATLSDASYSERAKNVLRFSPSEIAPIRSEMESYDANQVEFNLMTQLFDLLDSELSGSENFSATAQDQLARIADSLMGRFHPSLILYFLKRLNACKRRPQLTSLVRTVTENLRKSLDLPKNQMLLLEALASPAGKPSALQLIKLLPLESWKTVIDILILRKNERLLVEVLDLLKSQDRKFEETLLSLGVDRLSSLVPSIMRLDWGEKKSFLVRCLSFRNPDLIRETLAFVASLEMPHEMAWQNFKRLGPADQRLWLDRLLAEGVLPQWRDFARLLFTKQSWRDAPDEVAVLMLRIFYKYFQSLSINELKPFVEERRFALWPAYPHERDLILSSLMTSRDRGLEPARSQMIAQESRLFFQSRDLRGRLRSFNGN